MKKKNSSLILLLTLLLGAQTERLAAQQVTPSKQAVDPDDRTATEKLDGSAGQVPAGRWHWSAVDADFGPLPPAMHVFRTEDSLQGRPSVAYYVSVPLKDKSILFTDQAGYGKRFTPTQYYQQEQHPILVINTSFFSFKTNGNLNVVVKEGKMVAWNQPSHRLKGADSSVYHYMTRGALGISRKRKADVAWIFTDSTRNLPYAFEDGPVVAQGPDSVPTIKALNNSHWRRWKMQTAVGGGPVLIHNGVIRVTNQEEWLFIKGERDLNPRSAIGYTRDGRLIVLAVQGRTPKLAAGVTLLQEAKILLDLGCYEALNLDGGGSSCLLVNGKETIHPSDKEGERPVPSVFLIKEVTR
jgi:exopolysaccharide biosynthesis protein